MNEDFTMFQTLYKFTFLIRPFTHTGLQFVQGWAHICHKLPGLKNRRKATGKTIREKNTEN